MNRDVGKVRRIAGRLLPLSMVAFSAAAFAGCGPDTTDTSVRIAEQTPDPAITRDARVANIYSLARKRDVAGLLALENGTSSATPVVSASASVPPASTAPQAGSTPDPSATLDPAIALGLFVADRSRFRDQFIAAYPHDVQGVDGDFGTRLVNAHLVAKGALFPLQALGDLAIGGNGDARRKLLAALPYANGHIGDAYAREAARMLEAAPPDVALLDLAALPSHLRIAVTSEVGWCTRRPDRLLAAAPEPIATATPAPLPAGSTAPSVAPETASPGTESTAGSVIGPSASPAPLTEALVQEQIRQTLAMCDYLTAEAKRDAARHRKNHTHHHAVAQHPTPKASG